MKLNPLNFVKNIFCFYLKVVKSLTSKMDDVKLLYFFMDIFLWIHRLTFGFGFMIEILVTLVFITRFIQKSNDFLNAYFVLFFTTMVFDLPLLILRYPVKGFVWYFFNALINLNEIDADSYFSIVKSYFSFCQLIMTVNRFTGLLYPISHDRVRRNLI